jgi:hypothetical protein
VPFHPIDCRLKALFDTTQATVQRGALWAALTRASGNASERLFTAAGYCSLRRTNVARRHLRRATTLLARYVALLVGPAAEVIPLDARNAMLSEAVSIRD